MSLQKIKLENIYREVKNITLMLTNFKKKLGLHIKMKTLVKNREEEEEEEEEEQQQQKAAKRNKWTESRVKNPRVGYICIAMKGRF